MQHDAQPLLTPVRVGLYLVLYAACGLFLRLANGHPGEPFPFWPEVGVSLGIAHLHGRRAAWLVFAGACAAFVAAPSGKALPAGDVAQLAIAYAAVQTGTTYAAHWLLRRLLGAAPQLDAPAVALGWVVIAAVLRPAVAVALYANVGPFLPGEPATPIALLVAWLGSGAGTLVTPAFLGAFGSDRALWRPRAIAGLIAGTALVGTLLGTYHRALSTAEEARAGDLDAEVARLGGAIGGEIADLVHDAENLANFGTGQPVALETDPALAERLLRHQPDRGAIGFVDADTLRVAFTVPASQPVLPKDLANHAPTSAALARARDLGRPAAAAFGAPERLVVFVPSHAPDALRGFSLATLDLEEIAAEQVVPNRRISLTARPPGPRRLVGHRVPSGRRPEPGADRRSPASRAACPARRVPGPAGGGHRLGRHVARRGRGHGDSPSWPGGPRPVRADRGARSDRRVPFASDRRKRLAPTR